MNMFLITVTYQRQTGDDNPGLVKESYVASGMTPADVQKQVLEEIAPFVFGELDVPSINKCRFFDIFKNECAEYWYEAKVEMIIIDGDTEKRKKVRVLVQANTVTDAAHALDEHLSGYDCEIISISKSNIVEVFDTQDAEENN